MPFLGAIARLLLEPHGVHTTQFEHAIILQPKRNLNNVWRDHHLDNLGLEANSLSNLCENGTGNQARCCMLPHLP